MHIRHSSTIYRKYYSDTLQHTFIQYNGYLQDSKHDSVDIEEFTPKIHVGSRFIPIVHVASRYNKYNELIPRRAYYEKRFIDGSYQDVVIILAEVNATVLNQNLIEACQLNNQYSTAIQIVRDPIMDWVQTHKKGYTHFFAVIYCFGLQQKSKKGDSTIKVIYRIGKNSTYRSVNTETSLHIRTDASHVKLPKSLVVCATMYGHPVRFDEWLRYQKTIGVDRVHVSAQVSFFVNMEQYPFLAESLANGFVKIEVWKRYLKESEIFYHSQSLIYQDCVMQYRQTFEYAMMIDYDEFFIPAIPNKKNIHYYVDDFFATKKTASVKLPWIQFHCKPLNYTYLADGNITRTLSGRDLSKRTEYKSIHRLDVVEIVSIHAAYKTIPGYSVAKRYGMQSAYIAHIRPNKRKCRWPIATITQTE